MRGAGPAARLAVTTRYDPEAGMTTNLLVVPGIGGDRADALAQHGIETLEQLAEASVDRIAAVPGFGPVTAQRSKRTAQELLLSGQKTGEGPEAQQGEKETASGRKERKKDRNRRDEARAGSRGKGKDKRKGKGKDKKSKKRGEKKKRKKNKKREKKEKKKKGKDGLSPDVVGRRTKVGRR